MNAKIKNILWIVFAIVLIVVVVVWMFVNPGPDHIEDTNGADNYSLQTITEQDVVELKMGSRGGISTRKASYQMAGVTVSDGIHYSSGQFTGVYEIYSSQLFKGSDIYVSLTDFTIESGNFAFYIVFDGKIVGQVEPGATAEFTLDNVDKTGVLQYIIAGESASFEFTAPTTW